MKNIMILLVFFAFLQSLSAQVDHWETIVFAEDNWQYFVGNTAPPSNWNQSDFDASSWSLGRGGFGYGDEDDGTIIEETISVYLTKKFTLTSTSNIAKMILDADFDDGFVAYLNGQELTRINMGTFGTPTNHQQTADGNHEARLYRERNPDRILFQKDRVENLLKVGENTLAIEVHNVNATSSDLSSNFYLSLGKTDAAMEYAAPPNWFVAPVEIDFTSSNLPIMLIETTGQQPIPDEPKITARMGLIHQTGGRNAVTDSYNEYDGVVGIELRGSSSQSFPKKGYGLETRAADGSNNNVELLGMPKENDWVLHGPFSDKSLIRNALAYEIGRELMDYAPRTRFCELMINQDYRGVYLLTEKIKRDGDRVDINNLKEDENSGDDLTGGYILKIDKFTGANNDGWTSAYQSVGYNINFQYDFPAADEITSEQKNYIQNYISDFEDVLASDNFEDTTDGYRKYMDVKTFIQFWMVNELTKNVDGYRLSTYFYKDKNSIDSKLKMGPVWDFNLGFGNADYCTSGNPEGWVFSGFNEICPEDGAPIPFWWERLMSDPMFQTELVEDWRTLRQSKLSTATILAKVDSMQQLLAEAQVRNFQRWDVLGNYVWPNFFVADTYEEEMTWLKNWIRDRLNWMDGNIDFLLAAEHIVTSEDVLVFPNPFQDELTIEVKEQVNASDLQLRITDVLGKTLFSKQVNVFGKASISLTSAELKNLASGVYFYSLEQGGAWIGSGKIVKE